ncbi:MAG: heterodisulfide reductase-related iron-sulfur binding cluster [Pirellula sp.]
MEHKIDLNSINSPQGEAMAHAISTCVHCGFCLPACPTYQVLGEEMDSPRGRIVLMRGVLEESLPLSEATPYLDRCLGCLGCVTACPSGVAYGELLSSFRSHTENRRTRPIADQLARSMAGSTLPYKSRFRWAAWMGRLAKPLKHLFPKSIRAMLDLVPIQLPPSVELPEFTPARTTRRGQVGLLAGCVQQIVAPEINLATIRVLSNNGFDVVVPRGQGCCGALSMHTGNADKARRLARVNLDLFPHVDHIITNAAGCGSGIHEYELLFRGHSLEPKAAEFASRVQDISQFLASIDLVPPTPLPKPMRVAYHDACHLAHAQGIMSAPRKILKSIPGLELVEVPEGEICCGSAGTYNMEQPEIAGTLGHNKAKSIASLHVDAVVMGNIGCMVQIEKHLAEFRSTNSIIEVLHTVQLLDRAYR